jgi:hypothetical protein
MAGHLCFGSASFNAQLQRLLVIFDSGLVPILLNPRVTRRARDVKHVHAPGT